MSVYNILLGVTGSVAAIKTAELVQALRQHGHRVQVLATHAALYFLDPQELPAAAIPWPMRCPPVLTDADEWPGRDVGMRYERGQPVLHIELRRWADALVLAPLDAHTLAKLALGLCDNCLSCVWRAWDCSKPVVLAPAMNTLMWEHPLTRQHLVQLYQLWADEPLPSSYTAAEIIDRLNALPLPLRIVPPICKTLACGDVGVGAMAEPITIADVVHKLLTPSVRRPPDSLK